jgi:acetolactate synthase-1/2/3 large subunit
MMTDKHITVAQMIAQRLKTFGVRRMFGVPGGGSSLDLIEAAAGQEIEFHLTKREDSAVMMAATTAELTGTLGVALTTKGPGVANAANGVAFAALDRAPVVVFTDGFSPQLQSYVTHQYFDQKAMLEPVTKGYSLLIGSDPSAEFDRLVALAWQPPFGPIHIELTGPAARQKIVSRQPEETSPRILINQNGAG